jgi:RimJ/RimL family protein N-acetyltransferase
VDEDVCWSSLLVRRMTAEEAEQVACWRYKGDWSIYDVPSAQPLIEDLGDYCAVVANQRLIGFCCIGAAARVPGLSENPAVLDVGIGMNPELVGVGHGVAFGQTVLRYLTKRFPDSALRAVVQSWNQRSLRLTQRLGFEDVGDFTVVQGGREVAYRIVVRHQGPARN